MRREESRRGGWGGPLLLEYHDMKILHEVGGGREREWGIEWCWNIVTHD